MEVEMRHDEHAHLALALFAAFMAGVAMAASLNVSSFSSALNADRCPDETWSAGVQLAVASAPLALETAPQSAERTPTLTLAKQKAAPAEVCAAKCDKAYRYCYSQGSQVGKPGVAGGPLCQEQKDECLRACPA